MFRDSCPLCLKKDSVLFQSLKRDFYVCNFCDLIYVSSDDLLSEEMEKKRYMQHDNSNLSDGYRRFLYNIINPIKETIDCHSLGLDYGSGPYPMMSELLKKEGFLVDSYDPYFGHNLVTGKYDFLILCEVIEHFNRPFIDFENIVNLLASKAYIFIQTSIYDKSINFQNWYYKNDTTHVSFYSVKTFEYISHKYNLEIKSIEGSIIVLKNQL